MTPEININATDQWWKDVTPEAKEKEIDKLGDLVIDLHENGMPFIIGRKATYLTDDNIYHLDSISYMYGEDEETNEPELLVSFIFIPAELAEKKPAK